MGSFASIKSLSNNRPAGHTKVKNRWDSILPVMRRLINSGDYPGIGLLVFQHGQILFDEAVGVMDRENGIPLRPDTLVRLYSMTKPITCAALLMLLEEGKFLLEDPISRYIPAFRETKVFAGMNMSGMRLVDPERPMSIRHLFTHTSGLSYPANPALPVDQKYIEANPRDIITYASRPLAETVDLLAGLPLVNHPGTVFNYSMSHDVLGHLVSLLADMPFEEFTKTRIFDPLGMEDTDFWVPPEKSNRLAALYSSGPDGKTILVAAPGSSHLLKPPIAALGGTGLISTQRDYLRFARMLLNGGTLEGESLLSRKTVELMSKNHLTPAQLQSLGTPETPNQGFGYGLGVGVMMDNSLNGSIRSNGSFGWGGAAGTDFIVDPSLDLVMVMTTQRLMAPYPHSILLQNLVYQALE